MCDCLFLTAWNAMTTHTIRMLKVIHPLSAINTEKRVLPISKFKGLLSACDEVLFMVLVVVTTTVCAVVAVIIAVVVVILHSSP